MSDPQHRPDRTGWELTLRVFSSRSLVLALGGGVALAAEHCGGAVWPLAQQAIQLHGSGDAQDPDDPITDRISPGAQ